jgi:hypothetical protein
VSGNGGALESNGNGLNSETSTVLDQREKPDERASLDLKLLLREFGRVGLYVGI